MDLGLKDKVAAVTGGSVGIGLAIARSLAAEGVHLALCARNQERVLQVAREIGYENPNNFIATFKKHFGYLPGEIRRGA